MLMWIVSVLVLLAGGVLGAANLIVAKKPDAKALIERLTPFQGIIGIVMMAWGVWGLINMFSAFAMSFYTILFILTVAVELGLGFLLAFGLISKYALEKNAQAKEKGEQVRAKLAVYQAPMGLSAIALAVLFLVVSVMH
jgi:hypothetical protein